MAMRMGAVSQEASLLIRVIEEHPGKMSCYSCIGKVEKESYCILSVPEPKDWAVLLCGACKKRLLIYTPNNNE